MPYIFVSTVALFSNLYRCAPLVVGDKDSDRELMEFLGAKYTNDYPGHKSPVYVLYATPRSLMDALQTKGYAMISTQMFEDYVTWTFSSPLKGSSSPPSQEPSRTKTTPQPAQTQSPTNTPATNAASTQVSMNETPPPSAMSEPGGKYSDEPMSHRMNENLHKASSSGSRASRASNRSLSSARKKMDFREIPNQSPVARPPRRDRSKTRR